VGVADNGVVVMEVGDLMVVVLEVADVVVLAVVDVRGWWWWWKIS